MNVNQIPVIMVENALTNLTVSIAHAMVAGMDQPAAGRVSFKRCDKIQGTNNCQLLDFCHCHYNCTAGSSCLKDPTIKGAHSQPDDMWIDVFVFGPIQSLLKIRKVILFLYTGPLAKYAMGQFSWLACSNLLWIRCLLNLSIWSFHLKFQPNLLELTKNLSKINPNIKNAFFDWFDWACLHYSSLQLREFSLVWIARAESQKKKKREDLTEERNLRSMTFFWSAIDAFIVIECLMPYDLYSQKLENVPRIHVQKRRRAINFSGSVMSVLVSLSISFIRHERQSTHQHT